MKELPKGLYKHFKGQVYEVLGTARHTESLDELVLYRIPPRTIMGGGDVAVWARPLSIFNDIVVRDNKKIRRFTKIEDV